MVAAVGIRSGEVKTLGISAYPAQGADAGKIDTLAVTAAAMPIRLNQAHVFAIVRGRISSPKVRAWSFSLDGHDFYVLRLGDKQTLVYDVATKQWHDWGADIDDLWPVITGGSWYAGRRLGEAFGRTNIVAGSDLNGTLYFVSPVDDNDDDPMTGATRPFTRQVTAQYPIDGGYDYVPCFGVQAFGSIGQATQDGSVALTYSDDRGKIYQSADVLMVDAGERQFRLQWPSLGSMAAPGRLFKITDTGALRRIDGLSIELPSDTPNG